MATITATAFNRNPTQIKRLAAESPVVITEHDRPTLVVLSYADYERLLAAPTNLATWLEADDDLEFDIDPAGLALPPSGER